MQRELALYARLISLAISNELIVIRSVLGSVQVAREFAEMRDLETGEHLTRIARYARIIAKELAEPFGKSDQWVEDVFLYAPLHDIGKIGLPDGVLLKPGRLTDDERQVMQTHTTLGLDLVNTIVARLAVQNEGSTAIMRAIVHSHHEMLDGSGYPQGLWGDAIPLEAQVLAVAEIFDALTSDRPYKRECSFDEAFAELDAMVAQGKLNRHAVAALRLRRTTVAAVHAKFRLPGSADAVEPR